MHLLIRRLKLWNDLHFSCDGSPSSDPGGLYGEAAALSPFTTDNPYDYWCLATLQQFQIDCFW